MAVHPSGNFAYVADSQGALINVFTLDSTGNMTPASPFIIPTGSFGEDAPLFLEAHPNGKFLFSANRGSVSSYAIDPTSGALSFAPGAPYDTLNSLAVQPFQTGLEATGQYLYVSNVSNTGIPGYKVDQTTGALTLVPGPLPAQVGGTFDLVANPLGPEMYIQIGNSINVFSIDLTTGVLTEPVGQAQFFGTSNIVTANVQ